jgi:hypothetical protein
MGLFAHSEVKPLKRKRSERTWDVFPYAARARGQIGGTCAPRREIHVPPAQRYCDSVRGFPEFYPEGDGGRKSRLRVFAPPFVGLRCIHTRDFDGILG